MTNRVVKMMENKLCCLVEGSTLSFPFREEAHLTGVADSEVKKTLEWLS